MEGEVSKEAITGFASAVTLRCEELLIGLEKDVKRLDENFEFISDQELSLIRASKFIKQAVDKIVGEREKTMQVSDSSLEARENLVKNRENAVKELEKALVSKETELANERFRLDCYRKDLAEEKARVHQEKEQIEEGFNAVIQEKHNLSVQMKKLDDKYLEIKQALSSFDEEKGKNNLMETGISHEKDLTERYKELERQTKEFELGKEMQMKNYLKIEENLKERDRNLEQKKESLQVLAVSLQTLKSELNKHHENVSLQMDSQFDEIKAQEDELKLKKNELDTTLLKLNKELAHVEALKNSLERAKKGSAGEESENKKDFSKNYSEEIQLKMEMLLEKEAIIDEMTENLTAQEKDLEDRWKYLNSMENLKEELERVQMLYQDMESDYENREILLQMRAQNLEIREKKALAIEIGDLPSLQSLNLEISEKLEKLQEEDEKITKAQEFVITEKEELDKSALMLQKIFSELSTQRKKFLEDQLKLELEKDKFIEVVSKLEEESKVISENEEMINSKLLELKEKELELMEKELELQEKELELTEREQCFYKASV